jgi:hypothetical protein
MLENVTLIS